MAKRVTMRKAQRVLRQKAEEYASASLHNPYNREFAQKLNAVNVLSFRLEDERRLLGKHWVDAERLTI